jgi:hypothetical protein
MEACRRVFRAGAEQGPDDAANDDASQNIEPSPATREQDHTKSVYGDTREAAMNERIKMLLITPLATRASNVVV